MAETTTTLSPNLHSYYFKMLLASAEKKLKLWNLGKKKVHPKGMGKDSYVLKFGNVAPSTTPLTEGTTPSAATIDTNKYTITIKQYGQYIPVSDFLVTTAIDPVLEDISKRLGYDAARTADSVIRDHLITAATSIQYVGSGNTTDTNISATEIFTLPEALKATRILRGTDAPMFDGDSYVWVVHPYIAVDMMADTAAGGFIELNKYVAGLADKPLNGEIGKGYGARVVESSNISSAVNAGSVNVYRTFMCAEDAFCVTTFDKNHMEMITKNAGSAGTADPLNQVATAGYKLQFGVQYTGGDFTNANGASPETVIQIRGAATGG